MEDQLVALVFILLPCITWLVVFAYKSGLKEVELTPTREINETDLSSSEERSQSESIDSEISLSVLEKDEIASSVVRNINLNLVENCSTELYYKNEILALVKSQNKKLEADYTAKLLSKFPSLKNAKPNTVKRYTDQLMQFGERLITKDSQYTRIIKTKKESTGTPLTPKNLAFGLPKKSSDLLCEFKLDEFKIPELCKLIAHTKHDTIFQLTWAKSKVKSVLDHIESDEELIDTVYSCLSNLFESFKKPVNKFSESDTEGANVDVRLRLLQSIAARRLLIKIRDDDWTGELVATEATTGDSIALAEKRSRANLAKNHSEEDDSDYKQYIVVIAQTATKVAKDFEYDSLLEIIPALSSYEDVKAAVDSLHQRLLPLYRSALKDQLEKYHPNIKSIDSLVDKCKIYGEKLILENEKLAVHLNKFESAAYALESSQVLAETQDEGEVREISKTHTWKDLSDKF